MKYVVVIPCCARDQDLLAPCIENLRAIGLDGPIYIAQCAKNPCDPIGYPESLPVTWMNNKTPVQMLNSLLHAVECEEADYAMKIDVDMLWLKAPSFLGELKPGLTGYQHPGWREYVIGAFYAIDKQSLKLAKQHAAKNLAEDVGVSRSCLAAGMPVHPFSLEKLIGYSPKIESRLKAGWHEGVHLGQGIARRHTAAALQHVRRHLNERARPVQ